MPPLYLGGIEYLHDFVEDGVASVPSVLADQFNVSELAKVKVPLLL